MSKEEFLKIQTCVLKVNIHCDGCKYEVKKALQKIDGVYTLKIDSEQGKVTVSGNVDPAALIKKLNKNGKHAEIWGASNAKNGHQNQLKNLQIDNGKGGAIQQAKGGFQMRNPQLQQLQQMKGFQDLKLPPQLLKDMKLPAVANKDHNPKSVRFDLPDDEDLSDDEYMDDDDDYDDSEFDEDPPENKMGSVNGNGQKNRGGNEGKSESNGGKKGGNANNNGGNQSQGGKNGGGQPHQLKTGGGTPNTKNVNANGGKKPRNMDNMTAMGGAGCNVGQMGRTIPMGQMSNLAAVQGLPTSSMKGGGAGYYPSAVPEQMAGNNPVYQQQLAAMMMNQQRANGNERFQPMMYSRQPPAVNYMPPYPYSPPPREHLDHYSMFSDDNGSGCTVM